MSNMIQETYENNERYVKDFLDQNKLFLLPVLEFLSFLAIREMSFSKAISDKNTCMRIL